jgi:ABC-type uncharacterized transport system permease subunit
MPKAQLAAALVWALLAVGALARFLVQFPELPTEERLWLAAVVAPSWRQLGLDPGMLATALVLAGSEASRP